MLILLSLSLSNALNTEQVKNIPNIKNYKNLIKVNNEWGRSIKSCMLGSSVGNEEYNLRTRVYSMMQLPEK
jgi:hypothetical protein